MKVCSSCSLMVKLLTKDSWSTSTICWPPVKLLICMPLKRRTTLSTWLDLRSRMMVFPILLITAGTGTSIKLNRIFIWPFASLLSVKISEEEPDNSLLWSTVLSLIGSNPGPKMPCTMSPVNFCKKLNLVTMMSERLLSDLCPTPSRESTKSQRSFSRKIEDTSTPHPNLSWNLLSFSRPCLEIRETSSKTTRKDTNLVSSSSEKQLIWSLVWKKILRLSKLKSMPRRLVLIKSLRL
mmetsp:Transcript_24255/g.21370  ORF Transcript_24255/g.21370 Transcript_24255/m.21370 type:complete len:237 (+) Transcript_24255:1766-2476(+)